VKNDFSSGDLAAIMDSHVGVGDDMTGYALLPGDSGLVLKVEQDVTALLISNHVVYVETKSLKRIN